MPTKTLWIGGSARRLTKAEIKIKKSEGDEALRSLAQPPQWHTRCRRGAFVGLKCCRRPAMPCHQQSAPPTFSQSNHPILHFVTVILFLLCDGQSFILSLSFCSCSVMGTFFFGGKAQQSTPSNLNRCEQRGLRACLQHQPPNECCAA